MTPEQRIAFIQQSFVVEQGLMSSRNLQNFFTRIIELEGQDRVNLESDFKEWFANSNHTIGRGLDEFGNSIASYIATTNNFSLFSYYQNPANNGFTLGNFIHDEIRNAQGENLLMLNLEYLRLPVEDAAQLNMARFLVRFNEALLSVANLHDDEEETTVRDICETILRTPEEGGAAFKDFYNEFFERRPPPQLFELRGGLAAVNLRDLGNLDRNGNPTNIQPFSQGDEDCGR